jgi:uncharacterized OsmC-like protein
MVNTNSVVFGRQQPLRARYVSEPQQAVTIKHARSRITHGGDPLHGVVRAGDRNEVECRYGIDAAIGGYDDAANPGDLLCAALAACLDSTIRMLADVLDVTIDELQVEVIGDVDVRGCMAIKPDVSVGFRSLACNVRLEPAEQTDPTRAAELLARAEKLCVNLDTLRRGVPVALAVDIAGTKPATKAA